MNMRLILAGRDGVAVDTIESLDCRASGDQGTACTASDLSVWEWTLDVYGIYPYPCDDCANLDSGSGRVLRGGAWDTPAIALVSENRNAYDPTARDFDVGLRCARAR